MPTPQKTKPKRGAPIGNQNNLRHGFYSKSFTATELRGLDDNIRGQFDDEIAFARINALHLSELLMDYKNISLDDFVSASNALNNYLDRIQSLSRARHIIFRNGTTLAQALEELRNLPVDEDWSGRELTIYLTSSSMRRGHFLCPHAIPTI